MHKVSLEEKIRIQMLQEQKRGHVVQRPLLLTIVWDVMPEA